MSTTNTPNYMEDRINMLTKELASKRRATNWATNLTLIVGLFAILMLCGYFGYGYYMLNDITQPEKIVGTAKSYLQDYSVEARKTAAEEVKNSAPIWAAQISNDLISNMPTWREKAETSIVEYLDQQLQQSQDLTRDEFAKLIENHHADFEEAINIMAEKNKSDEFVDKIMPLVEEQYGADMESNVHKVLGGLQIINQRLDRLASGENLTPIEEQQRHILGLTRTLRD